MIFDMIANIKEYTCIPYSGQIQNIIQELDFSSINCGDNEIRGRELFLKKIIFSSDFLPPEFFEAHRKYADLHLIIEGEELIHMANKVESIPASEYNSELDYELFSSDATISTIQLKKNRFALFMPGEIHKSGGFTLEPGRNPQKIVFKIACETRQ